MRAAVLLLVATPAFAADVESRVLTHYVPQDLLETVVRKDKWTEVALAVKGGVRKGDTLRIWAGEKGSPACYTGTFGEGDHAVSGSWVYPGGGGYESTMTRIDD